MTITTENFRRKHLQHTTTNEEKAFAWKISPNLAKARTLTLLNEVGWFQIWGGSSPWNLNPIWNFATSCYVVSLNVSLCFCNDNYSQIIVFFANWKFHFCRFWHMTWINGKKCKFTKKRKLFNDQTSIIRKSVFREKLIRYIHEI